MAQYILFVAEKHSLTELTIIFSIHLWKTFLLPSITGSYEENCNKHQCMDISFELSWMNTHECYFWIIWLSMFSCLFFFEYVWFCKKLLLFQRSCSILHSHQQSLKFCLVTHPCQPLCVRGLDFVHSSRCIAITSWFGGLFLKILGTAWLCESVIKYLSWQRIYLLRIESNCGCQRVLSV